MTRTLSLAIAVAMLTAIGGRTAHAQTQATPAVAAQIAQAEEAFRLAKLTNNVAALDQILDAAFVETNQNGNSRNKAQMIELFQDFPIDDLTNLDTAVRMSGAAAMMTGTMIERRGAFSERMLFTRVYVNRGNRWLLLASSQFVDPRTLQAVRVR